MKAKKKEKGAPCKLSESKEKVLYAIKLGATYALASAYAGISYDTFNNWMNKGEREKEGDFFDFFHDVKKAEGEGSIMWLAKIEIAATNGSWQAAAWKLERRHPESYGKSVHVNEIRGSSDDENKPIRFTIDIPKNN